MGIVLLSDSEVENTPGREDIMLQMLNVMAEKAYVDVFAFSTFLHVMLVPLQPTRAQAWTYIKNVYPGALHLVHCILINRRSPTRSIWLCV